MLTRIGLASAVIALNVWPWNCASAETIQITMDKLTFSPAEITVKVGDTIEWINRDILAHTATARSGEWNVKIAAKKTERLIVSKAGAVDYYCTYHPNMTGRILIKPK
jgi:plastocyanin